MIFMLYKQIGTSLVELVGAGLMGNTDTDPGDSGPIRGRFRGRGYFSVIETGGEEKGLCLKWMGCFLRSWRLGRLFRISSAKQSVAPSLVSTGTE